MSEQATLRATLRLTLADGVGAVLFRRLVEAFQGVENVPADNPPILRRVEGIGEKISAAIAAVTPEQIDQELAEVERFGARILCRDDADFPESLRHLHDCPPLLYVRGTLSNTDALAIGIVGSRHCTHYGLEQGERFGQLLGRAGFSVISGGRGGIDRHRQR